MQTTTTDVTPELLAANRIIDWIMRSPVKAVAITLAEGESEYEPGDDALAEHMNRLLYTPDRAFCGYAVERSLVQLRTEFTQEEFNKIDWSVVREALLGNDS